MQARGKGMKTMITNFISLVLLQGINYVLPLVTYPFLFRVLGVERWGLVSFGYAVILYFSMFTEFGFSLSATKYISENREDLSKVNTYLNSAMICRIILCLVSFLILLLLIFFVEKFKDQSVFYLLFFGVVIGNTMFPLWFFQGMENMKYITVFNLAAKSLSFIPFFVFIKNPDDYIFVPVFYSLGYISAGIISLYFVYNTLQMKYFYTSRKQIWFCMKDSSTYFLSRLSVSLFTTSNLIFIGFVGGDVAAGYYSAAEKLYQAYNQMLTPFSGVLFPHIAKTKDVSFFKKVFNYITGLNLGVVCLVLLLSSFIIQLIYAPDNDYSTNVFRILTCACFVTIPSMLLGYPFLAALGHPHYTNWTTTVVSIFHVAGICILFVAGIISIYTVAVMVVLTETLNLLLRIYGVKKYKLFTLGK